MLLECLRRGVIVFQGGDRGIKLRGCDEPVAERAAPALFGIGYDPDHISDHGFSPARVVAALS